MKKLSLIACLAMTAACAPRPDAISPVAAQRSAYSGFDCSQLQRRYLEANVRIAGSDRPSEIASAKGQVAQLQARFEAQCQASAQP